MRRVGSVPRRDRGCRGVLVTVLVGAFATLTLWGVPGLAQPPSLVSLPAPRLTGPVAVEEALYQRRSIRRCRRSLLRSDT